jgi:hypothetical protein
MAAYLGVRFGIARGTSTSTSGGVTGLRGR